MTRDPGNTEKPSILITWEPGHTEKEIIVMNWEPGNTETKQKIDMFKVFDDLGSWKY